MKRKIPYDQFLILIVLALVGFGLVMVFSASTIHSEGVFIRQFMAILLGLLVLLVTAKINYQVLENRYLIAGMMFLVVVLLGIALFQPSGNGAHRWIRLGPLNFQPSELAKLVVVTSMSYFLVKRGGRIEDLDKSSISYLAILGSIVLLVFVEPDLGTSTSLALTIALMLFLGGLRFRYYLGGFLVAAPLFYALILRAEYRRGRILAFLDPASDPYGLGYQIRQSLTAVGSGGLTGVGLAQGTQKLFYLPEPHTDFIFAVIGEEVGLVGCLTILLLFVALFWRGVRVSLRADTLFGTYLGLGIISVIVFQAFFNISVVLSLCPTKGIPLPFISVGGSSMLVMLAGAGILLNISKHARRENLTELKS
jgi:cell division protein FtsW